MTVHLMQGTAICSGRLCRHHRSIAPLLYQFAMAQWPRALVWRSDTRIRTFQSLVPCAMRQMLNAMTVIVHFCQHSGLRGCNCTASCTGFSDRACDPGTGWDWFNMCPSGSRLAWQLLMWSIIHLIRCPRSGHCAASTY